MKTLPKIVLIKDACPICHSDVRGNDKYKYLCVACQVLFNHKDLSIKQESYSEHAPQSIKGIPKHLLKNKFIVSLRSNKYHWINCPYIRKILEENLFYFNIIDHAVENGYEACVCMKNRILTGYNYVMAKDGKDYHVPNCPFAQSIKEENRVFFDEEIKAVKRKPCRCIKDEGQYKDRAENVDTEKQEEKLEEIKQEKQEKQNK